MRLVVFGWGNDARGDDGLGPLLLERVARAAWPDVTTVEDFQLQIEHALDLDGAEAALFVDAGKDTPAPFRFTEIGPERGESHTTHALAPEAVLDVYARSLRQPPPSAFTLCMRGERFELGEGLSTEASERLEAARAFVQARDGRAVGRGLAAQAGRRDDRFPNPAERIPNLRGTKSKPGGTNCKSGGTKSKFIIFIFQRLTR